MKKILAVISILIFLAVVEFTLASYLGGYPVGFHKGHVVVYRWSCFDYCPGGWFDNWDKEYYGVETEKECKEIGGVPLFNWAWGGGFIGCAPD